MPRYDGMEDILQQVQHRMVDATPSSEPVPEPQRLRTPTLQDSQSYAGAVAAIVLLLRDAEHLHEILSGEEVRSLSQSEQEDVLSLLRRLEQKISRCEDALQRVTPLDN